MTGLLDGGFLNCDGAQPDKFKLTGKLSADVPIGTLKSILKQAGLKLRRE